MGRGRPRKSELDPFIYDAYFKQGKNAQQVYWKLVDEAEILGVSVPSYPTIARRIVEMKREKKRLKDECGQD